MDNVFNQTFLSPKKTPVKFDAVTFRWEIKNIWTATKTKFQSDTFQFVGGSTLYLTMDKEGTNENTQLVFFLCRNSKTAVGEYMIKLCLVDSRGLEHFAKEKTIEFRPEVTHVCLMKISKKDLFKCDMNIISQNTLIAQCSLCEDLSGFSSDEDTEAVGTEVTYESKGLKLLSTDFEKLYAEGTDFDTLLKCGDVEFKVHRAVLLARSIKFDAKFSKVSAEGPRTINIPDFGEYVLSDVFHYVYTGKINGLTASSVSSMFLTADYFGLDELKQRCLEFFKCHVTMENFCEAAELAYLQGQTDLKKAVKQFFDQNLIQITRSERWQQLLNDKQSLATTLLESAYVFSKAKM